MAATHQYARAIHAFQAQESGDLGLRPMEVVKILQKDESGWWLGQKENGERGEFPYNYVEIISKEEQKELRDQRTQLMALKAAQLNADGIARIQVNSKRGEVTFEVYVTVSTKKIKGVKAVTEFRDLDEKVRGIIPDYDCPLPPVWADHIYMGEESSKARALVLEHYLFKLSKFGKGAQYLIVKWVDPNATFDIDMETMAKLKKPINRSNPPSRNSFAFALDNVYPLARVEYTWLPKDEVELHLREGEIIAIRKKETSSKGWWEGETADGQRGLFPSNYISPLSESETRTIMTGLEPTKKKKKAKPERKAAKNAGGRSKKQHKNFALPSIPAFDELLNNGYAILSNDKLIKKSGMGAGQGDQVTMSYVAFIWDCQNQQIAEVASSDLPDRAGNVGPMVFSIGAQQAVKGIELAVKHVSAGQSARVVLSPDLAYGEVGSPPLVPPNCHLVYDITVDSITAATLSIPGPPPMSPQLSSMRSFGSTSSKGLGHRKMPSGKPQTLVEAVAERAAKMSMQAQSPSFGSPVQQRTKKKARKPHGQGGQLTVPVSNIQKSNKMYDLATLREIVRTKAYEQYGVDPTYIEGQLLDDDFRRAFGMEKNQFILLPRWRQVKLKKENHLF
eukprot:CAMPEP_0184018632 /NCGR_PEP_ID=MMETSP0954-20121128/8259_1 /TAXON_ID=627963 /ORGANISM="Aplanochytrium sp, Strain PBS07" /LENGTH=618 /DNA_ID=CAMNT_0026300119 /DNA_START=267 /DNA_END=2123 /DNA_ORIENTATION=-